MNTEKYVLMTVLFEKIEVGNFHFPKRFIRSLDFGMRMFAISFPIFRLIASLCVIILPLIDFIYDGKFFIFTLEQFGLFIFWTIILVISTYYGVSLSVLMLQQSLFIHHFYRAQFKYLKLRLNRTIIIYSRKQSKCCFGIHNLY